MNTELLTARNIAAILFLALAWIVWGKSFVKKHITAESVESE